MTSCPQREMMMNDYTLSIASENDKLIIQDRMASERRQTMNIRLMKIAQFILLFEKSSQELVGWFGYDFEYNPDYPETFSLYIHPDHRGKQLSVLLRHAVYKTLFQHGVKKAYLRMEADSNQRLIDHHLASGFFISVEANDDWKSLCLQCELYGKHCRTQFYLMADIPKLLAYFEFKLAIGADYAHQDMDAIQLAQTATFKTDQKILAILQPKTTQEVSACVKIANQYHMQLYPVSGGKNWGYGSRVPVTSGAVLLDLSRMNQIVEINEELAYAVIEAGVTQSQLLRELQSKTDGRLWLDTVASSPNASLIGNAMERGHGTTPYCDRIQMICNFEVVLPTGEVMNTNGFANSKTQHLDAYALGPGITPLFTQANLGIVTRMTLWLYPKPDAMKIAIFSTNSEDELQQFIDRMNQMRIKGIIKAGPHIANHFVSMIRMLGKYPYEFADNQLPLSDALTEKLCGQLGLAKWTAIFGLWDTSDEIHAVEVYIEKKLENLGRLSIWDKQKLMQDKTISEQRRADLLNVFSQMSGDITAFGLARPYWRHKANIPENIFEVDLDKDRCGYLSINPCAPATGRDALFVATTAATIIKAFGFEPNIAFYGTRPRILQFHISICFNREDPTQDQQALECQAELSKQLQAAGYYSFRLNVASMHEFKNADEQYLQFISTIKNAVDPNKV